MSTITKAGTGINVLTPSALMHFENPLIVESAGSVGRLADDMRPNLIEIQEGAKYIAVPMAELTAIGGSAPAGTLAGIADQIMALTT